MQYDRQITISVGSSRRSVNWQPAQMLVSELWAKLKTPARSKETLAEYLNLKKQQQDDLKDSSGGFLGGTLNSPRRKANNVMGRDIITLDLDNIPAGGTDNVLRRVEALGCGYCVYSTRKHQNAAPRLRVLFPLDRTVNADEYEPCARRMAEYIGLELADPTTFEVSRLMYWPSCCRDSQYVYIVADKPFLQADGLLATYADWRDVTQWPAVPGQQTFTKLAVKQGDPEGKNGVIGAFCRTYDIHRAMDELLPGIYEPVDTMPGRYTYLGGSTTGGAVLYDNGKFLYSHHSTDPCSGRLVNAFDLVRLHRFSDKDDEAQQGTPTGKLPSYQAMREYAIGLPDVSALMVQEDFGGLSTNSTNSTEDWATKLTRNQNGDYQKTLSNLVLLLENLPELNGCARLDAFTRRICVSENLPWRGSQSESFWKDPDTTELRVYMERWFKPSKVDVNDAVEAIAQRKVFHSVQDYLTGLKWDGNQRAETILINQFGAADDSYVRAITRAFLVGAVKRIMQPGCKHDYMLVLVGRQGAKKSSFFNALGKGWFSDSITTFDGQKALEALQGKWIIEVPEMQALGKMEMDAIKAFITKQSDFYRAAYAHFPADNPRQCVLVGTTNNAECLRDTTGGRRFWPIDIEVGTKRPIPTEELGVTIDQIWAEVLFWCRLGEKNYLTDEMEKEAGKRQEMHREANPWEDTIYNFLNTEIPTDWSSWPLEKRRIFWEGNVSGDIPLKPRGRVCVVEIWREAFMKDEASLTPQYARAITNIINATGEWKKVGNAKCGKPYGTRKAYEKAVTPTVTP